MRRALAPLARLADETGASVLVVRHLTKGEHQKAIYAGGGSIAIIGQARVGLLVAEDPDDPATRILAVTKCNIMEGVSSIRFRIAAPSDEEPDGLGAPTIEWLEETDLAADQLVQPTLSQRSAQPRGEAADFLRELLADGPHPSNSVSEEAERQGIAVATLNRAKREIGVESRHRSWLAGRGIPLADEDALWFWWIPEESE